MPDVITAALHQLLAEQTPAAVPPFVEVRHRARVRARTRVALGAVATAVTVAGGGALAAWAADGGPSPSPAGSAAASPPDRITVNGRQLTRTGVTEVDTAWVDEDDPSTLVVLAGTAPPHDGTFCNPYTVVRLLGEDADTVRIVVDRYEQPPPSPLPGVMLACPAVKHPAKEHRLELGAAVAGRAVLNGATAVPVHDAGTVFSASYLPPGFSSPGRVAWDDHNRPELAGYSARTYRAGQDGHIFIRAVDPVAEAFDVSHETQPSLFRPESGLDVIGRPTVRGHEGLLIAYSADMRCVRWRESRDLAVVVCWATGYTKPPPAIEELLRVAESLYRKR
jgi:hypothetical protein